MEKYYSLSFEELQRVSAVPLFSVQTENDLYWEMALSMYETVRDCKSRGRHTAMILPVGPVFQYRRLIRLLESFPMDLSDVHFFFMDEYLDDSGTRYIDKTSPLSFRGFIQRELIDPMDGRFSFDEKKVHFADPDDPKAYDDMIEDLGGIDLCHAGVGITGHLAFNEPISEKEISADSFANLGTRVLEILPQTITINSNTALSGAWDEIPRMAITVGMRQILGARRLRIYMNRDWQKAVLRKAIMLPRTPEFPVTLAKRHGDVSITVTPNVAETPEFALK